jgi:integrase
MHRRNDRPLEAMVNRARTAAKIPDLTFRMCRTTFATLFEGDIADAQASMGHHAAEFTLRHYRKTVTVRHQQSVEELDRKLKVVPIKTGAA